MGHAQLKYVSVYNIVLHYNESAKRNNCWYNKLKIFIDACKPTCVTYLGISSIKETYIIQNTYDCRKSTGISNKVAGVYVKNDSVVKRERKNSQIYEIIPTCRLYLIRENTTGDRIPRETRNKTLFFNYRVINTAYTCRQLAITQSDVITTWEEYYYNRIHNNIHICLTARYTCPNTYAYNSDTNNIFYEKTFGAYNLHIM